MESTERLYPNEPPQSINEICDIYGIKPSTAYKWRTALQKRGMELSWDNLDRIERREINLRNSALVATSSTAVEAEPVAQQQSSPQTIPFGALGISQERLLELNAEVQAETRIKSVLRSHYEQEEAARAADRATKLKEGVMAAAPESIISWVQSVARTA